ncbi:MAG: hypothetical protein MJ168_09120 [Clostridia bacterium]|nr:hypothetical protein [Clostridia bacterium]
MRKIVSFILSFVLIILPFSIISHAEEDEAQAVFSLNIVTETEDYVTVSLRLDSGSFNSIDLQFVPTSDKIADCVYIDESDELYVFMQTAKRAGGAVISIPYTQTGKYGFATTIAYDTIDEDIIICKFLKAVSDDISADDISVNIISCTDSEQEIETKVLNRLPIANDSHQHDYITILETVPETCCADGYTVYQCSCGSKYTAVIPAHGHTLLHMKSAVVCGKAGIEFDFCTECNGIFNKNDIEPSEHKWSNTEITSFPTEKQNGIAERKCSVCGKTEIIELAFAFKNCNTENNIVSGLKAGITAEEFKKEYTNDIDAEIIIAPYTGSRIGTGSTVTVVYSEGVAITYTVLIYGDVTGDGWYDGQDALLTGFIVNGMLTEDNIGTAAYKASDCNRDGVTDSTDVDILNQAGILLSKIDQSKATEELIETSSAYADYIQLIEQDSVVEPDKTANPIFAFLEKIYMFLKQYFAILRLR